MIWGRTELAGGRRDQGVGVMHIAKLDIIWLPPLEDVVLDFNERANLFIGPNASGKSTLLRAIKMMHSFAIGEASPPVIDGEAGEVTNVPANEVDVGTLWLNYGKINDERPLVVMESCGDWPRDISGANWNAVPFLYIPPVRLSLPAQYVLYQSSEMAQDVDIDAPLQRLFDTASGVFNGRLVDLAVDWLLERRSSGDRQLRKAMQIGYSCAKSICAEVIYDPAPHSFIGSRLGFFGNEEIVANYYGYGIGTSDDQWGIQQPLFLGALSSGTQGTLLWVWALALKMAHHYGWSEGWEKKPAILLIDEIENHLHPTWQRRVIPKLLEHFPGLQIFATTHSPFVVAGLKAGQVHLLKRDENGVVTATTHPEDIVGWTADEILRNMMGVEDPTDQRTVDRANRLRQLREKESLTAEEESELAELRRQVNEDLLSKSGQLGAQQERYADLMERFLLSRQSGPTQDGE